MPILQMRKLRLGVKKLVQIHSYKGELALTLKCLWSFTRAGCFSPAFPEPNRARGEVVMRGETSLIEQSFYQKERVARKGRMGEEGLGTAKSKAISHPLKGDCFLPLNSPKICGFVISQAGEDMCPPSPHSSCTFPKILKEPSALPPHCRHIPI